MSGLTLNRRTSATCPRCGFDLRTATSGWTNACPLTGRCTECGLDFQWGDRLNPAARPPQWNIEYCPARRWPLAFLCTLAATLACWPLWARLRMEMDWRPRRLVTFTTSLLLLFVLVPYLGNAALALRFWWQHRDGSDLFVDPSGLGLPPRAHPPSTSRGPQLPVVLIEALVLPLASRSNASVIVDGYELPSPSPRERALSLWSWTTVDAFGGDVAVRWTPEYLRPGRPWEIIGKGPTIVAYGRQIDPNQTLEFTPSASGFLRRIFDPRIAAQAPSLLLQCCAMVAIFAVLPTTRRRCKVKWQHLARISLYSLTLPILTLVAVLPVGAYLESLDVINYQWSALTSRVLPIAFPVLLAAWWAVAIHRYLKMPHAMATASLAALAGWMLASVIFWKVALAPVLPLLRLA